MRNADKDLLARAEVAWRLESDRIRRLTAEEKKVGRYVRQQLEQVEAALSIATALAHNEPKRPVKAPSSRATKAACAVVAASDWHIEERVIPSHVNGLNEYGPGIAAKRSERFVEGVLWLLDTHRSGAKIDTLVLGMLGDFITGWIHEENLAGNALAPTEAVLLASELLETVVRTLLARGALKSLRVVCTRGNHGRTTKRTYINAAARLSYEWLMYRVLARRFEGDKRVEFTVEDGYHTYVPVYDKVIRFHHGDAVKYEGGVGGLTIPLRKKIARWNQARHADLDIMGHYHQLQYGGDFVVNGSLIGWNDYANWIGASPEPPQQAFLLLRPGRGVASFDPIFVTDE